MTKFLGIEFAPLHIPLQRRLETLAVAQWTLSFLFLGFGCLFLTIYITLCTQYYYITLIYLVYLYFDQNISYRGGRRSEWVRNWRVWKYFQSYFPIELVKTADLDPNKNYLMGFHPHGIFSTSAFCHFGTEGSGWSKAFPGIRPHLLVLAGHFHFPFYRDYLMCSGTVCVSSDSMRYILTKRGTGNALGLVVGGALEALEAFPGRFTLKLKKKKGFIKMALTTGSEFLFSHDNLRTPVWNEMIFGKQTQHQNIESNGVSEDQFSSLGINSSHLVLNLKNRQGVVLPRIHISGQPSLKPYSNELWHCAVEEGCLLASLLPIFSFGETDIYDQVNNPEGSLLRKLQNLITKYLGFSPPMFHGRGIFNYTFGILPYRKPVHTVFGKPIDVELTESPTQEQIDNLHQQYLDSLQELFETYKVKYGVEESKKLHFID